MKPAHEITDRAKRYRAQRNKPPGPRRCNVCSSRENVDIDHITGDESDGERENLWYLCRPCNARKAVVQKRNRIGIRTRQFNPAERRTFSRFQNAALVITGLEPGDVAAATAYIHATPPEERMEFSRRMAANEKKGNPLYAPQAKIDVKRFRGVGYGLEVDITGHGRWVEQGPPFRTRAEAEKEGRAIRKKEGMNYRVKITRDVRNPEDVPDFKQYAFGVSIHKRGAKDEGGKIIHATPPATRSSYARKIAEIKRSRRGTVPF